MLHDFRDAFRTARRQPGFAGLAVLTLGLGIGVVTTMFSLLDAVLFRPLPYPDWRRIVVVRESDPGGEHAVAPPAYFDWRDEARLLDGIAAVSDEWFNLVGRGEPERLGGARVTAEFGAVMRVAPALGRWFGRENETPGSDQVVVTSHSLWQRRFGGDSAVVGSAVTLTDRSYTIVGVMPPGFDYPEGADVWAPLVPSPALRAPSQRRSHDLGVVARLAPGISLERADAELDRISAARRGDDPMLAELDAPLEARLRPRLAAAGALLGLAGAAALTRVLRGLLFGVSPADPATFGAVAATLGAVALLASFVPALRAARIDPVEALRQE